MRGAFIKGLNAAAWHLKDTEVAQEVLITRRAQDVLAVAQCVELIAFGPYETCTHCCCLGICNCIVIL